MHATCTFDIAPNLTGAALKGSAGLDSQSQPTSIDTQPQPSSIDSQDCSAEADDAVYGLPISRIHSTGSLLNHPSYASLEAQRSGLSFGAASLESEISRLALLKLFCMLFCVTHDCPPPSLVIHL